MLPAQKQHIPLKQIQHKESATLLLGCGDCHLRSHCGGLQLEGPVVHCLDFCNCSDPHDCDVVCTSSPARFVKRMNEINGFGLDGIKLPDEIAWPSLPIWMPVIEKPLPGLDFTPMDFAVLPIPDRHFKFPHLWTPKFLQAGQELHY